jgi:hypothetical protein
MSGHYVRKISFIDLPIRGAANIFYTRGHDTRMNKFPNHARGFFYHHHPVDLPSIASSIRLRCTPSSDPASFSQGEDLVASNGLPWEVSTLQVVIAHSPYLRDYFLHAGLVTDHQMTHWRRIFEGKVLRETPVIYRLDQPFVITFHSTGIGLRVIVGDFIGSFRIQHPFRDIRAGNLRPYHGSCPSPFRYDNILTCTPIAFSRLGSCSV